MKQERFSGTTGSDTAPGHHRLSHAIAVAVLVIPALAFLAGMVLLHLEGIRLVPVLILAVGYILTGGGIGIGYHRLVSHKSFQTRRVIRAVFAVFGSMAAQGPVLYWAAIHRRHHAHSDEPGDPHSPHQTGSGLRGLWHAHVGWLFEQDPNLVGAYTSKVARDPAQGTWERYVPDLVRDPLLVRVHRLYPLWVLLGLLLPTVAGGLSLGSWTGAGEGLLWGGLVRIFLTTNATMVVNSLGHRFGTSPFRTRDDSKNSLLFALPTFGDAWHNNHHAFPWSAWHGLRWWEIDLSGWAIRLLGLLGLAWNLRVPDRKTLEAAREQPPPR